MSICAVCHNTAICEDMTPLRVKGEPRRTFYCITHKKLGLSFGWLDKGDLQDV